jgi:transposase InsO family protein
MGQHHRAALGPAGRAALVELVSEGASFRQAAACLNVAPATAHRWWHRWRSATDAERVSLACLRTRSSRPRSCPWALTAEQEQRILDARARTNWGPMRLTWLTGRHRSTVWKVLARHGVSRQRRTERPQSTKRYEWTEAGALLHIDAFELPKFDVPGHWAHGDRGERHRTRRAGKVKVIGVIDDHTRLAYCEIHAGETAATVSATLLRADAWMREQGCGPAQAVMSDNAKCYATSHQFAAALTELGARHILIPPRTPRWNGKIERFFRTLDTEWAHGRVWPNSTTRDRALSSFLRFYNRRRPHTAADGRPPISRVH